MIVLLYICLGQRCFPIGDFSPNLVGLFYFAALYKVPHQLTYIDMYILMEVSGMERFGFCF
jgi:hypothetical protein